MEADMKIYFEGDKETVFTWRLDFDRSGDDTHDVINPVSTTQKGPIGSLLLDFLAVELMDKDSFKSFVKKWGLAGLKKLSETASNIGATEYESDTIDSIYEDIWSESFDQLSEIQNTFRVFFYHCFDLDGPTWTQGLSAIERYYIITHRWDGIYPDPKVQLNELNIAFYLESNNVNLNEYIRNNRKAPEEEIAKLVKGNAFEMIEMFSSGNIASICYAEFKKMLDKNAKIRRCGNCNEYFIITGRKDTLYCDRLDEYGRSCKSKGPMKKYINNPEKDPLLVEYRKAYKSMWARTTASREGTRWISENAFEEWKALATEKMEACKKGDITPEQFKEWIKESKEGK